MIETEMAPSWNLFEFLQALQDIAFFPLKNMPKHIQVPCFGHTVKFL